MTQKLQILRKLSPHLLVALITLLITGSGLGYRYLWQDEIETAERARTILESGVPRIIDRSGAPSVNAGGREIEDGDLHRYTPWGQFYFGAAGLAVSDLLHAPRDQGIRMPFAIAHAAVAGIASYGLFTFALIPQPLSVAIGLAIGAQSIPLIHSRTARYHALLDLLFVLGLFAVGAAESGRRWGKWLLGVSIFLLPHSHTLGGSALSLTLGGIAAASAIQNRGFRKSVRPLLLEVALPGFLSLALVLILTRPWVQESWGGFGQRPFRSIRDFSSIGYSVLFALGCSIWLFYRRNWKLLIPLSCGILAMMLSTGELDKYSFSQPRYYLAFAYLGLLWPLATGLKSLKPEIRKNLALALLAAALTPDLILAQFHRKVTFRPFQGIRIAASDTLNSWKHTRQPFREIVQYIRERGKTSDPVLFEYVPQFANWYLPGHPIALMPDLGTQTKIGKNNPIWKAPLQMPKWHIWYPESQGLWVCGDHCDFKVSHYDSNKGTYLIHSKRLGLVQSMCIVRKFPTDHWNNAPFRMLESSGFRPEGSEGSIVLGEPCGSGKRANLTWQILAVLPQQARTEFFVANLTGVH